MYLKTTGMAQTTQEGEKIHQADFVKNIKIKKIQGSVNSTPSASDTGKNRLNFDPRFCVINDGILFKTLT